MIVLKNNTNKQMIKMCFKCYTSFRERLASNPTYINHESALELMKIEETTELNMSTDNSGNFKMAPNTCNEKCIFTDSPEHEYIRANFFKS